MSDPRYLRPEAASEASDLVAGDAGAVFLAGGTELVPWLRDGLLHPTALVDLARIGLNHVELLADGGLALGAAARLAAVARAELAQARAAALVEAIESAASPAIRASATLGGSLLQLPRCPYLRGGPPAPCELRKAGSGCSARTGDHRGAGIFPNHGVCIAAHPSDPAVALVALGAEVELLEPAGERRLPLEELLSPTRPWTVGGPLAGGGLIARVLLSAAPATARSTYLKVRDRASFDFALVSCAATASLEGGVIRSLGVALGGVASGPWRCRALEDRLRGRLPGPRDVRDAVAAELAAAAPLEDNRFKVELAARLIVRALDRLGVS
ncbi:MAG: xanthine dehydrogenase family protein subunit M [Gemmatimonadales bacterium]